MYICIYVYIYIEGDRDILRYIDRYLNIDR